MNDTDREIAPNSTEQPDLELSVIIPARNEERSLPACLASLLSQSEPGFALGQQWELIIINDDSTDKTREIAAQAAASHDGVTLLDAPPLDLSSRGGFTGKSNACWTGAQAARGRHLLFTDADTIHEINDLSRSLREAERYKAVLLSYSPRQIVTGFWQHAVMPLVFSELASVYPPQQVNDPVRSLAAANGQFILVERDAYFSVGGHRAVGKDILEDVALAYNIKRGSRIIRFRYAPDALSTQMYRTTSRDDRRLDEEPRASLPQAHCPGAMAHPRPPAILRSAHPCVRHILAPAVAALRLSFCSGSEQLWRFYSRVARSNFPAVDVAISILGVPLFVFLLLRSVIHHRLKKTVAWKGRTYNTTT